MSVSLYSNSLCTPPAKVIISTIQYLSDSEVLYFKWPQKYTYVFLCNSEGCKMSHGLAQEGVLPLLSRLLQIAFVDTRLCEQPVLFCLH